MVSRSAYRRAIARLTQTGVAILIILVFLSAADGIPSISDDLIDRLTILDVLGIAFPILMVALVLSMRASMHDALFWGIRSLLGPTRVTPRTEPLISALSFRLFNIMAVAAAWILSWRAQNVGINRYPDYEWVLTVAVLAFLGLLLLALLGAYLALQPLLEESGVFGGDEDRPSGAAAQNRAAGQLLCPNCGTSNAPGMKFCGSCGGDLAAAVAAAAAAPPEPAGPACAQCGRAMTPGNVFCTSCGARTMPA